MMNKSRGYGWRDVIAWILSLLVVLLIIIGYFRGEFG